MISATRILLLAGVALLVSTSCVVQASSQLEQPLLKTEESAGTGRVRVFAMPGRLSRLIASALTADGPASGFKRASSLDTLSGMMPIGKRSAPQASLLPVDFINVEPVYPRHYPMRPFSRMYDMRWMPLDYAESSLEAD